GDGSGQDPNQASTSGGEQDPNQSSSSGGVGGFSESQTHNQIDPSLREQYNKLVQNKGKQQSKTDVDQQHEAFSEVEFFYFTSDESDENGKDSQGSTNPLNNEHTYVNLVWLNDGYKNQNK
ncbi:hypothetical protein FG379_002488, partial [Cryptosporidium bovis]|uniref:uncharacterized protein n=1 Tax=Cryptosporidium bovis TaxID=310047 RepID=UPI003519E592